MGRKKIDWQLHIENYRDSGLSIPQFCKLEKVNVNTFRTKLYGDKGPAINQRLESDRPQKYIEFDVRTDLTLSIENDGTISIRGLSPIQIPLILQACSNAVSQ